LENILQSFEATNLQLHPGKCVIVQPKVQYLIYVLLEEGITASADKIKAVKQYPTPKGVKEVRAFIGLACFYRRLVPDFAELAKPLKTFTRKDQKFTSDATQQEAFESLKEKFCSAPVLAFPDFKLLFILTTDASKVAVDAIFFQVQNGLVRPIVYASRQLNKVERAYTVSEQEMLALVWATKQIRCYLYGKQFLARTEHFALKHLQNFANQNSRLMRWSLKLSELDFVIEHSWV